MIWRRRGFTQHPCFWQSVVRNNERIGMDDDDGGMQYHQTLGQQEEQDEMKKSESIKELATALAKAQASMENAAKDTANPFFKSKYADLASVVGVIREALSKHGLSFVQVCHDWDKGAKVETIILHESGEWLSCGIMAAPATKADAQGFGSALTYARRYGLSAAFGVATEDDDGNAASRKREPAKPELLPCTDATITANIPAWKTVVQSGKKTADTLMAFLRTKNTLTAEQEQRIRAGVAADIVDAEFVNEMEGAEK